MEGCSWLIITICQKYLCVYEIFVFIDIKVKCIHIIMKVNIHHRLNVSDVQSIDKVNKELGRTIYTLLEIHSKHPSIYQICVHNL